MAASTPAGPRLHDGPNAVEDSHGRPAKLEVEDPPAHHMGQEFAGGPVFAEGPPGPREQLGNLLRVGRDDADLPVKLRAQGPGHKLRYHLLVWP